MRRALPCIPMSCFMTSSPQSMLFQLYVAVCSAVGLRHCLAHMVNIAFGLQANVQSWQCDSLELLLLPGHVYLHTTALVHASLSPQCYASKLCGAAPQFGHARRLYNLTVSMYMQCVRATSTPFQLLLSSRLLPHMASPPL